MPEVAPTRPPVAARMLQIILAVCCCATAAWLAWDLRDAPSHFGWALLWCVGMASLALTPRLPMTPAIVYIACVYGVPRSAQLTGQSWQIEGPMAKFAHAYSQAFGDLLTHHVSHWISALAVLGVVVYLLRQGVRPPWRSILLWLVIAWVVWVGVTCAASVMMGTEWQPELHRHPAQFVDALAICFVAACVVTTPARAVVAGAALVVTMCVMGLAVGLSRVNQDADFAALVVIALPMAALGVRLMRSWIARAIFVALGLFLLLCLVKANNRGAFVALLAVAGPIVWLFAARWRPTLLISIAATVIVAGIIRFTPVWSRFQGIWQGNDEQNSVMQRIELWLAGYRLFLDHPLLGVGPGNFHEFAAAANENAPGRYVSHNNFVSVAGETGAVGLLLYSAIFIGAIALMIRVACRRRDDAWGATARALVGSLVAYVVVGQFISRHDMVLAYLLVGAVVAVATMAMAMGRSASAGSTVT